MNTNVHKGNIESHDRLMMDVDESTILYDFKYISTTLVVLIGQFFRLEDSLEFLLLEDGSFLMMV